MLKKFCIILCCFVIGSCALLEKTTGHSYYNYNNSGLNRPLDMTNTTDYSQVDLGNSDSFRVAMLLPLSGNMAATGQGMKNAATMAIGDINNNNLVVQFYDTKGTTSGARVAIENALGAGSQMILGPLTADEVMAVSDTAKSKDVPVISFSTSPSVLSEGIYSLGLFSDQQIERIVHYAAGQGRRQFAAVLPNNQSGINMFKSFIKAARNNGVQVTKVGFYAPDTMEFTGLVTSMIGGKGTEPGFDALLIPESGNRLKAVSSMFSYYDVASPNVLYMGTSIWANTGLSKETELYGAVYPVMSLKQINNFNERYNELFGERPNGLSIFAYDAVALSAAVAAKNRQDLYTQIENADGYYGMSGVFRVLANGQNEHGLDVVKVSPSGEQLVENAPQRFYDTHLLYGGESDFSYMNIPQIYGQAPSNIQSIWSGL